MWQNIGSDDVLLFSYWNTLLAGDTTAFEVGWISEAVQGLPAHR